MAKSAAIPSIEAKLAAARQDLSVAINHERMVAGQESESLASDAEYIAWSRSRRLAEHDRLRLVDLIASLEEQQAADERAKVLEAFDRRYNAAVDANDRVAAMLRKDLPRAWEIISAVLRAAAEAEIETDAVRSAMPPSYRPLRSLIDADAAVRCQPASPERVLSEEITELFVDPDTNGLFADQSAPPKNRSFVKRRFRVTSYTLHRRAQDTPPFAQALMFPRLSNVGAAMFDGTKVKTPRDVLLQLAQEIDQADRSVAPLTRIEPV